MGGGHHFEYPKWVWSPAGGWWPKPQAWKRNTMLYATFVVGTSYLLYLNATPKTVAYHRKDPPPSSGGSHH